MDGVAYALGNLAPLHLMCDRRDIDVAIIRQSGESENLSLPSPSVSHSSLGTLLAPRIYIYERIPAGIGFSAQLYERHDDLLAGAAELIRSCACRYGCPACVGPVLLVDDVQLPGRESAHASIAPMADFSGQEVSLWDNSSTQSGALSGAQLEPRPLLETKRLALALLAALTGR
jgi:DEAD/DEAH box helicase domain-containing protein